MESFVAFLNRLSDIDWGWWPLLRLRPAKDTPIGNMLIFKITLFFSSIAAIAGLLVSLLIGVPFAFVLKWSSVMVIIAWISFFVIYKFTFAMAWNIRVKQLRDDAQ